MVSDKKQIQNMVIELCEAFTQKTLSSMVGVPQGTLSKIKNGKLDDFSFKKADAIRNFYLSWKEKAPVVQN
ncbi:hypothetical protein ACX1NX_03045 [Acinetobacter sp. ANC 5383]